MNRGDLINGAFELAGAAASTWNIITLCRHKQVRGFSSNSFWYFFAWGCWNLWYYPSLGQWMSFSGGIALTLSNGLYAALSLYFLKRGNNVDEQNCTCQRGQGTIEPEASYS